MEGAPARCFRESVLLLALTSVSRDENPAPPHVHLIFVSGKLRMVGWVFDSRLMVDLFIHQVTVRAAPLKHGVPCVGFSVEEADRPGR